MSAWQPHPTVVWLPDGEHTVILLVMGLPERQVLGATIVQNPRDAATLMRHLLDAHGSPSTLRSIWDPMFGDLNAAAREAVRKASCAEPTGRLEPDDFTWALETGNTVTATIRASEIDTVDDVALALRVTTPMTGDVRDR